MSKISLSYAWKDKRFCLCATIKGTSKRNYKEVQSLINPNYDSWDKKKQLFNEPTPNAIHNNDVLRSTKEHYQYIIDMFNPMTPKDLFNLDPMAYKTNANSSPTLKEYLDSLILDMHNAKHKVPSTNYRLYITLLNKLKKEGCILNVPISDITDEHFEAFSSFILNELQGINYIRTMKLFKSTINKAKESKLTTCNLTYRYTAHAPKTKVDFAKAIKGIEVLSKKEYKRFTTLDLSQIPYSGKNKEYYKELYRDFCIFMYEMKIRPVDAIVLHLENIRQNNIVYVPVKKKNYLDTNRSTVVCPISTTAKAIINKYQGQSKKGYIFPFALNERDWNMFDANSYNKWYLHRQKVIARINNFLKKVNEICAFDCENLTTYVFRHSTFTHCINDNSKSIMSIAKEGGTSVAMLEKNYYNHIKQ